MDPNKLFKDLTWANFTIVGDELICLTLMRNHYDIQHTKIRVLLLTN